MTKPPLEKNIPLPPKHTKPRKYHFEEFEAGDSCLYREDEGYEHNKVKSAMRQYAMRTKQHFVSRTVELGTRIWRIE